MKLFEQIEGLTSNFVGIIKTAFSIMKLEARLAGLSVFPLLLNLCMLLVVLITFWLSLMLLVGYVFTHQFVSLFIGIGIVILLNLALFFLLVKYLRFNLRKMSFEKTRHFFSTNGENEHDKLEKTSDC